MTPKPDVNPKPDMNADGTSPDPAAVAGTPGADQLVSDIVSGVKAQGGAQGVPHVQARPLRTDIAAVADPDGHIRVGPSPERRARQAAASAAAIAAAAQGPHLTLPGLDTAYHPDPALAAARAHIAAHSAAARTWSDLPQPERLDLLRAVITIIAPPVADLLK